MCVTQSYTFAVNVLNVLLLENETPNDTHTVRLQ